MKIKFKVHYYFYLLLVAGLLLLSSDLLIYPRFFSLKFNFNLNYLLLLICGLAIAIRYKIPQTKQLNSDLKKLRIIIIIMMILFFIGIIISQALDLLIFDNYTFAHTHLHPDGIIRIFKFLFFYFVASSYKTVIQSLVNNKIFYLPLFLQAFGFYMAFYQARLFWYMEKEDSLTETLTFVVYVLLAFLCFKIAIQIRKKKLFTILFVLAALIFVLIAGEEISWGQRIFNFETPEHIAKNNTQKEFNLHNQRKVYHFVYDAYITIGVYALVTGFIKLYLNKIKKVQSIYIEIFCVDLKLAFYFIPMILYSIGKNTKFYKDWYNQFEDYEEFEELLLSLGMFFHAYHINHYLKKLDKSS